jgi:hypothetical protein
MVRRILLFIVVTIGVVMNIRDLTALHPLYIINVSAI